MNRATSSKRLVAAEEEPGPDHGSLAKQALQAVAVALEEVEEVGNVLGGFVEVATDLILLVEEPTGVQQLLAVLICEEAYQLLHRPENVLLVLGQELAQFLNRGRFHRDLLRPAAKLGVLRGERAQDLRTEKNFFSQLTAFASTPGVVVHEGPQGELAEVHVGLHPEHRLLVLPDLRLLGLGELLGRRAEAKERWAKDGGRRPRARSGRKELRKSGGRRSHTPHPSWTCRDWKPVGAGRYHKNQKHA